MKRNSPQLLAPFLIVLVLLIASDSQSQVRKYAGTVQRIKIHGKSLEGNLDKDSVDRWVTIYLPASYNGDRNRRYPVIYFLHGYTDDDAGFYGLRKHWMNLVPLLASVFASGMAREMIVVTPNAYTRFQGSMYSNSVTTGNWEDFVTRELVSFIDGHYRTMAKASSRGLAGHSMGGYGTSRIGQKTPDVFSNIYLLSPCCLSPTANTDPIPSSYFKADSIKTFAAFESADFGTKALFASAAAWSPNPAHPPFYLDLPLKNGVLQPAVLAKWDANRPLVTLASYITNLARLKAVAFDAGTRDVNIAASIKLLDSELKKYKISHTFELYEGDHIDHIAERIAKKMLPFFSENLSFDQ